MVGFGLELSGIEPGPAPDSFLAIVREKAHLRASSLHHEAVRDPGADLSAVERELYDITQAVESTADRPVVGVQWHPEYLNYLPSQYALFRWLRQRAG